MDRKQWREEQTIIASNIYFFQIATGLKVHHRIDSETGETIYFYYDYYGDEIILTRKKLLDSFKMLLEGNYNNRIRDRIKAGYVSVEES